MIKIDFENNGLSSESAAIIDIERVRHWQNGPTAESIVNARILQGEQRESSLS